MNKANFKKLLTDINIELSDNKYYLLEKYAVFLQEYNSHTNLTAIKDELEIFIKHFYDSLTITKIIDLNECSNLLDIGTGAGFPGVVLKIFYPHLKVTLLDSNNKKTKFLEELLVILQLDNVIIINDRAENYVKKTGNTFDIVTARAVANLRVLSEISLPFVKKEGFFIAMKGNAESEIKEAETTIKKMDSNIIKTSVLELPENEGKRTLIKIKKERETNLTQLRPYNKILKSALK